MAIATEKDIPEIRARLEALGYRGIEFAENYGFIQGIAVEVGGSLKAVRIDAIGDLTHGEATQAQINDLKRSASVDGWIKGVCGLLPLQPSD